jgi:hypothetical protein
MTRPELPRSSLPMRWHRRARLIFALRRFRASWAWNLAASFKMEFR